MSLENDLVEILNKYQGQHLTQECITAIQHDVDNFVQGMIYRGEAESSLRYLVVADRDSGAVSIYRAGVDHAKETYNPDKEDPFQKLVRRVTQLTDVTSSEEHALLEVLLMVARQRVPNDPLVEEFIVNAMELRWYGMNAKEKADADNRVTFYKNNFSRLFHAQ